MDAGTIPLVDDHKRIHPNFKKIRQSQPQDSPSALDVDPPHRLAVVADSAHQGHTGVEAVQKAVKAREP